MTQNQIVKKKKAQKSAIDKPQSKQYAQHTSFEAALQELEFIASQLQSGLVNLDQTVSLYSRGRELHHFCMSKLKNAEFSIKKVELSGDNAMSTENVVLHDFSNNKSGNHGIN